MTRILIVEDDGLIAFDLAELVESLAGAEAVGVASVARARMALLDPIDFAFLDINVADGTTYDLARSLKSEGVGFAFTSAVAQDTLPADLAAEHLIAKPFAKRDIEQVLRAALPKSKVG